MKKTPDEIWIITPFVENIENGCATFHKEFLIWNVYTISTIYWVDDPSCGCLRFSDIFQLAPPEKPFLGGSNPTDGSSYTWKSDLTNKTRGEK